LHNLLFAYQENPTVFGDANNIPESANGVADLLDEVKVELNWLIKMQDVNTGAVLSKVSVTQFQAASPASNDVSPRYYGAASTSSTLTAASVFAHASMVYRGIGQTVFADSMLAKAKRAYDWAVANPSVFFSNAGFQSANPEVDAYNNTARRVGAAALLYGATGQTTYRDYVDAQYSNLHHIQWTYFYAHEGTYGDLLVYYSLLPTATSTVAADIKSRFQNSTNNHADFYPNYTNNTDAYRAYLKNADYNWGSNETKSKTGLLYTNMIKAGLNLGNHPNYWIQAGDFLHFIHGVNPLNMAMLSNVVSLGGDNYNTKMYHTVYGETSAAWNNNPPPAYVTGGVNPTYTGSVAPPSGEPIQKAYKDWNTGYPENSWEVTEPALYYQAPYIRLLSKFASNNGAALPLDLLTFDAYTTPQKTVRTTWTTAQERNLSRFELQRSRDAEHFNHVETIGAKNTTLKTIYTFEDKSANNGLWYYRLKMIDVAETFRYSNVVSVDFGDKTLENWRIYPNPIKNNLVLENNTPTNTIVQISVYNVLGQLVHTQTLATDALVTNIETAAWESGLFFLRLSDVQGKMIWQQSVVKE
jgi:Glycosyl hydrolase family 9/Secretion system C-terminal sorting domain